jgi:hypothetical protein
MQFSGFTPAARQLYVQSRLPASERSGRLRERQRPNNMQRMEHGGAVYLGTRFSPPRPPVERSPKSSKTDRTTNTFFDPAEIQIFQGIREDVFETILRRGPEEIEIEPGLFPAETPPRETDAAVSVFRDGTILVVEPK